MRFGYANILHVPQSLYSGSVWDIRIKMTNMEVRVGWSTALSNGKGLLNKRGQREI